MGFICVLCVILSVTYYVNGATLPARAVNFGILFLLCIFLEYICNRSSFDQQHMFISSFIIIVFFFGSLSLISLDSSPKSGSDGVWTTVVFIYMVYTLLPIRMRLACLAGFLLSVINISCMIKFTMHEDFVIKQVSIIIVHCDSFQIALWIKLVNKVLSGIIFVSTSWRKKCSYNRCKEREPLA